MPASNGSLITAIKPTPKEKYGTMPLIILNELLNDKWHTFRRHIGLEASP
jgi:hypothetical protein